MPNYNKPAYRDYQPSLKPKNHWQKSKYSLDNRYKPAQANTSGQPLSNSRRWVNPNYVATQNKLVKLQENVAPVNSATHQCQKLDEKAMDERITAIAMRIKKAAVRSRLEKAAKEAAAKKRNIEKAQPAKAALLTEKPDNEVTSTSEIV